MRNVDCPHSWQNSIKTPANVKCRDCGASGKVGAKGRITETLDKGFTFRTKYGFSID